MTVKIPENILPFSSSDPEVMSGVPVFYGTRVPVQTFFDYLVDGCSIPEFLENFPTVNRDQVMQLLESAASHIMQEAATR